MRAGSVFRVVAVMCFVGRSVFAAPPADPKYRLVLQVPPATSVDSVRVSPDGSVVASATGEGGVRLYDARDGRLLRVMGGVGDRGVVFTPDGQSVTAAGFHMDKLVALWDVHSGARLRTFAGQGEWEADATAVSPDGTLLASTGTDKQILVWEVATGKLRLQLKDQSQRVSALVFSPDGKTLAGGGGDKIVRLWDCATGRVRAAFEGQGDWICALAFSPDGKSIVSGSCDWGFHRGHDWPRPPTRGVEQWEWRVWDVATGAARRTEHGEGRMLSLAVSPDGVSLACGIGREVRVFGLPEGAAKVLASHDGDVTSVAFMPDGGAVVSGSHDQTVQLTRVASGKVEWRAPGLFEQVNSVAMSNDGSLLVTGSGDGRFARGSLRAGSGQMGPGAVRVWDARTGRMLRRLGEAAEQVMAVAVSPDGRRVAAGVGLGTGKGAVRVWDAASGEKVWAMDDHEREVLAVAFSANGSTLASGSADGAVLVRDAAMGAVKLTLADHKGGATSLVFSPDGRTLFVGQGAGGARVWDVASGQLTRTCEARVSSTSAFAVDRLMNSVALTKDGGTFAVCGSSVNNEFVGAVRMFDARTGSVTRDFSAESIHGRPMAISPDGSIIATGGKSVQLWDARTGKPLRKLYGELKRTQSIVFSADGRVVVEGGSYGTTNLWEVATGRHLATLYALPDVASGAVTDGWLAATPEGFYDGSAGAERYLAWRVGDELWTPAKLAGQLRRPERVAAALSLGAVKASAP